MAKKIKVQNTPNTTTNFQIKQIHPLTINQRKTFEEWSKGKHLLLHGFPGTGKSYIGTYLALKELTASNNCHSLQIFRSTVSSRNIGFLPGNTQEKIAVFEDPYHQICNELYSRGDAYSILKNKRTIEFHCTSFLRGITLSNSIVLVDEIQNLSYKEISTIITRAGKNTRFIFCGDYRQSDFIRYSDKQGLFDFIEIVKGMDSFSFVEFGIDDIVRSGLVKEFLISEGKYFYEHNL